MQLDLVNAQNATPALAAALGFEFTYVLLELVEVMYAVVADANGADFAGLYGFD